MKFFQLDIRKDVVMAVFKRMLLPFFITLGITLILWGFDLVTKTNVATIVGTIWLNVNAFSNLYFREEKRIVDSEGHDKTHQFLDKLMDILRKERGSETPVMAPIHPKNEDRDDNKG